MAEGQFRASKLCIIGRNEEEDKAEWEQCKWVYKDSGRREAKEFRLVIGLGMIF